MPLLDVLFSGVYGQFVELAKHGMELSGLAGGPVRDPLPSATGEQRARLERRLEELRVAVPGGRDVASPLRIDEDDPHR